MQREIVFLKLGGSLITHKGSPHSPRLDVLARLADEIAQALTTRPELALLLGHGSGSFGHVPAARHGTRAGVHSPQEWRGFVEVWQEARALDQLVIEALAQAGLPALAFPPSAWLVRSDHAPEPAATRPLALALEHGLLPLVQGDVAFDERQGGTIVSTEDVFAALAPQLRPQRVLLAGVEAGVWADYPTCTRLIPEMTPADARSGVENIQGSANTDVTGGMRDKVDQMIHLVQSISGLSACIFSGAQPGNLLRALLGEPLGTSIHS
jgi:isopentenyl phosphate kinase